MITIPEARRHYWSPQLQIRHTPTWRLSAPFAALLLVCTYGCARVGQRIGHEQTEELTTFLHQVLDAPDPTSSQPERFEQ